MPSVTTYTYLVEVKPAGTWLTIATSEILSASIGSGEGQAGDAENPFALGSAADAQATLTILRSALPAPWARTPIRITPSEDGTPRRAFIGVITQIRTQDGHTTTLTCTGYAEQLRTTRAMSPLLLSRPLATATTLTSVEDPANGNYAAGLLNYLLWSAGGRPSAQTLAYPSPIFYYRCDQGPLVDAAWLDGEDGWQEAQRIATDAGGLIYQDRDGVIVYRDLLQLVSGSSAATYNDGDYQGIEEESSARPVLTGLQAQITPRRVAPARTVIDDTAPVIIPPSAAIVITRAFDAPVVAGSVVFAADALRVTTAIGAVAVLGVDYTQVVTSTAANLTVTLTNATARPLIVARIRATGTPVIALPEVPVVAGTAPYQTLDTSPLVQRVSQAARRMRLYLHVMSDPRPIRTYSGMALDTARTVGEVVTITSTALGISNVRHLITQIARGDDGVTMDLTTTPLDGLRQVSDYFVISAASQAGQTRRVA